ncbi:hypothetical protein KUCAC02_014085 [Chaenocephalus aceratus]|uniref:Uncharacterized protein n=1 Tax=Chaenocephalus aceratus TaxID=36190 RepID=A0ACB9WDQ1_CHAAC|nr:hypothetical protein KUCAC02_014085 [Chaenocephalus aceratus]
MMKICSQDVKRSALILLMINSFCAFSQIPHDIIYVVGCFENGTSEVQYEFDSEEMLYMDFDKSDIVYTVPGIFVDDPSTMFDHMNVFTNANKGKNLCVAMLQYLKNEENNPPEEKDALFGHALLHCQFTSPDDFVYLGQLFFNKVLQLQYNSTLGKYTGYTEKTKDIAEGLNKNPKFIKEEKKHELKCKNHIAMFFDVFLKPGDCVY